MTFNYQKICDNFFEDLPERTSNVLERRFGLKGGERETLESIGKSYGICRERIRQIEQDGFSRLKPKLKYHQKTFQYFVSQIRTFGNLKKEDRLLEFLGQNQFQNQVYFLLVISDFFDRFSESKEFYSFWTIKKESLGLAQKIVEFTLTEFEKESRPFTIDELLRVQKSNFSEILNKNVLHSYLEISKKIYQGPEGQFGLKDWPEINPRGIKDKAYLVLKKEKKPMHFVEVANLIDSALPQTVHNELIKDQRFVLVGRGLYALGEWGYEPGVIKDIISKVLKEAKKPLSKEEILEKVLNQRFVKKNTILLNLNDKKYFLKESQGKYKLKEV
ncbi:sigma factor-like helix-turn-helix DNA-binding protein [Patescibacteria group bacterium]